MSASSAFAYFLIAGNLFFSQSWTAASLRWYARFTGFWGVNPQRFKYSPTVRIGMSIPNDDLICNFTAWRVQSANGSFSWSGQWSIKSFLSALPHAATNDGNFLQDDLPCLHFSAGEVQIFSAPYPLPHDNRVSSDNISNFCITFTFSALIKADGLLSPFSKGDGINLMCYVITHNMKIIYSTDQKIKVILISESIKSRPIRR